MNSRWGRHYANIVVYPEFQHEIRCCLLEAEKEQEESPRSDLLQFGRRQLVGAAY